MFFFSKLVCIDRVEVEEYLNVFFYIMVGFDFEELWELFNFFYLLFRLFFSDFFDVWILVDEGLVLG